MYLLDYPSQSFTRLSVSRFKSRAIFCRSWNCHTLSK